jgi:hypothetical protein
MLVKKPEEYPECDDDDISREALLLEHDTNDYTLADSPSPQKAVLFCLLHGQVRHLKWWLTK